MKALVKVGTLRFENGDFEKGEVIEVNEEQAERLKASIVIMSPKQIEVYEEVVKSPPSEPEEPVKAEPETTSSVPEEAATEEAPVESKPEPTLTKKKKASK